jgi:hypothetical protein
LDHGNEKETHDERKGIDVVKKRKEKKKEKEKKMIPRLGD